MGLILFLAGVFFAVYLLGKLLEKMRIPWIFSAVVLGLILAVYNPFENITSSDSFIFLAKLGMFFLLFIIGFELDFKQIAKQGKFILKTTVVIILAETILGSLVVHYVFNVNWFISILVASSFSTIGEAILLPILDEFKLTRTKLGQTILGIGVLDDVVELAAVIILSFVVGNTTGHSQINIWTNLVVLTSLFGVVFLLIEFHRFLPPFKFKDVSSLFLFAISFIFLFIGVGQFVESAALGALLAGIALRNIIPDEKLKEIDSEIRTISYGFFAPIFFLWVGIDTDISYLIKFPLLVLLVMAVTNTTKVMGSYLTGRKEMGTKKSIILGICLSVKFSTSIVVIKILFDNGLIQSNLYSVLIAATTFFTILVPFILSFLIKKWNISSVKNKTTF